MPSSLRNHVSAKRLLGDQLVDVLRIKRPRKREPHYALTVG